jgi:prepilin-type N-terminal cleavage/methylation domain-containing protein
MREEKKRTDAGRGRAGFTLVELMVAIFVGAIIIYGMYSVYVTGQRIFHEEHRISQAQLAARLGMEVIKNDIKMAGFMSTPNVNFDPMVCSNAGGPALLNIQSVVHTNGTAGTVFNSAGGPAAIHLGGAQNSGIAPDSILLTGNYVTSQSFLAQTIRAGAGQIVLQDLHRLTLPGEDPTVLPPLPTDVEFARMFPANSYIRVVNKYGFMMFSRITAVGSAASRTITVSPPLPDASAGSVRCGVHGYGEGSEVNVVSMALYRIEVDPLDATGRKTDLVRWQVSADGNTVAGTREIIVEYAVDVQVWFRHDDQATALLPFQPNIQYPQDMVDDSQVVILGAGGAAPILNGTLAAHPENLRVAIVRISVRTAEEDPTFPFVARAVGDPLVRFELNAGGVGSAHVRSLTAQVELPNIAFRNLRN